MFSVFQVVLKCSRVKNYSFRAGLPRLWCFYKSGVLGVGNFCYREDSDSAGLGEAWHFASLKGSQVMRLLVWCGCWFSDCAVGGRVRTVKLQQDTDTFYIRKEGEIKHAYCYTELLPNRMGMMMIIRKLGKYNSSFPRPHQPVSTNKVSCLQYVCRTYSDVCLSPYLYITEPPAPSLCLTQWFLSGPGGLSLYFNNNSLRLFSSVSPSSSWKLKTLPGEGWSCLWGQHLPWQPWCPLFKGTVSQGSQSCRTQGGQSRAPWQSLRPAVAHASAALLLSSQVRSAWSQPHLLPAVSAGVSSEMASAATRGPSPGPVHTLAKTQASHLCRYKRENVNWFWTVKSAAWNWVPYLKTYCSRMASARECCGAVVPHFSSFLSGSSPFLDVFQDASGN